MNEIIAHEYEYSEVVIKFLEEQQRYHERSAQILKSVIPNLRERLGECDTDFPHVQKLDIYFFFIIFIVL